MPVLSLPAATFCPLRLKCSRVTTPAPSPSRIQLPQNVSSWEANEHLSLNRYKSELLTHTHTHTRSEICCGQCLLIILVKGRQRIVQTKTAGVILDPSLSLTTHGQESKEGFAHHMCKIGQISAATLTQPSPGGAGCSPLLPSLPGFWDRVSVE